MQVYAFDEASADAFTENAFEFRFLMLHYASLMHACALIDMRQDERLNPGDLTVQREDPYMFRPNRPSESAPAQPNGEAKPAHDLDVMAPVKEQQVGSFVPPGASFRNHTVPLQMVLRSRQQIMDKDPTQEINSFEAMDAMEKAVRPTTIKLRPNMQARADSGRRPGRTTDADFKEKKVDRLTQSEYLGRDTALRRGSVSTIQFLKTTVLSMGTLAEQAKLARANSFEVVGGVSETELRLLQPMRAGDRSFKVQTWMVRMMTARLQAGGLAIPPPLLSRTYQVLSDGTAAASQARKISHVEFPFALRQLLAVLLTVFSALAPMCISAFIESTPLVAIICFFVLLGYVALNETARELEQPFGLGANDLGLTSFQNDFNRKLAQLPDLTIPELGYKHHRDYSMNHLSMGYDGSNRRQTLTPQDHAALQDLVAETRVHLDSQAPAEALDTSSLTSVDNVETPRWS